MTDDILSTIRAARFDVELAWRLWWPIPPPESVTLWARIVVGEDWVRSHQAPKELAKGKALLSSLKLKLDAQDRLEAQPGKAQDVRKAWDAAEERYLRAEAVYLRLVRQGVDYEWTATDEERLQAVIARG